ncbi:MAG: hypothetical protein KAW61_01360, partial [candidate division Zixibacteria bacterium]|nr:hypothetical protein [candidate division Zixibacteria bacterium]
MNLLRRMIRTICLTGLLGLTLGIGNGWAQRLPVPVDNQRKIDLPSQKSAANPYITMRLHDNGYLWTVMNNNSIIGNLFRFQMPNEGKQAPSFYHPGYSRTQHGHYAALWVGGVVRGDSLVTTGMDVAWDYWDVYDRGYPMEFWPDQWPFGDMTVRSNDPGSRYYDPQAQAELEIEA